MNNIKGIRTIEKKDFSLEIFWNFDKPITEASITCTSEMSIIIPEIIKEIKKFKSLNNKSGEVLCISKLIGKRREIGTAIRTASIL
jgi:hypothetical protein